MSEPPGEPGIAPPLFPLFICFLKPNQTKQGSTYAAETHERKKQKEEKQRGRASSSSFTPWPFSGFRTVSTHCAPWRARRALSRPGTHVGQWGGEFRPGTRARNLEGGRAREPGPESSNNLGMQLGVSFPQMTSPHPRVYSTFGNVSLATKNA